jgi:hypothetical protein
VPRSGAQKEGGTAGRNRWHHPDTASAVSTSPVRPGREHDTTCTTCARHHGLIDALNRIAAELDMPTLTDLGYENAATASATPSKKPAGGEPTEAQQTYNKVIRGIHGLCERANALLKTPSRPCAESAPTPAASRRSPPQPSFCSSSSTTAPSERSHTVIIHY